MDTRNLLVCLDCGHQFFERVANTYRRCGSCGSTAVVQRQDIKSASLAIKPWAALYRHSLPPLPSPGDVVGFPLSLGGFFSVMGKARTGDARRRAARLMLDDAGFGESEAEEIAASMYPD